MTAPQHARKKQPTGPKYVVHSAVGAVRRFLSWYRTHRRKPIVRLSAWAIKILVPFILGVVIKPALLPWFAEHFAHQHRVNVLFLPWRTDQPKCTIETFALEILDPVKELHIALNFKQPIRETVLQRGYSMIGNDVNVRLDSSTPHLTPPPCEITSLPADVDQALTFAVSSDRHQLIVSGHDLTHYDTQTLLMALYPDDTTGPGPVLVGWEADATYDAFGYPVPIRFSFFKFGDHAKIEHWFDSDSRLVQLH